MPHKMPLDEVLIVIALASYVIGALSLLVYFFSREDWLRNLGATLAVAGCIVQFAQLIARYETTHIWPLLNLYGSLSLFAAMGVAIFSVFAFRYKLWFAGALVLAIAAIALAYGVTWDEGTMPAVPSLQSYWAKIHVPLVVSAYGAFLVSFVFSILYLVKYYAELAVAGGKVASQMGTDVVGAALRVTPTYMIARIALEDAGVPVDTVAAEPGEAIVAGSPMSSWLATLPSLGQIDVLTYRAVAVGLPLLTLGIITGAMWAHESWGAYWQWDPKETAALFSWIVYAIYMHLHTRAAWKGLRTSWICVAGFASIVFCYLGVNIWISGLHSYKM
ncbi:MAG TPA: c-type cytochrome biogenesis protein CcsB [Candidatus Baltobacteraceae bacterium]